MKGDKLGSLALINQDGSNLQQLTSDLTIPLAGPHLWLSGHRIAFIGYEGAKGYIFILDPESTDRRKITAEGEKLSPIEFIRLYEDTLYFKKGTLRPDRSIVSYSDQFWSVKVDGSGETQVESIDFSLISYSPDSTQFVYSTSGTDSNILYLSNKDHSIVFELSPLPRGVAINGGPSWSPDSKHFLLDTYSDHDGSQIYVWQPPNPEPVLVIPGSVAGSNPWSPDGQMILYSIYDQKSGTRQMEITNVFSTESNEIPSAMAGVKNLILLKAIFVP